MLVAMVLVACSGQVAPTIGPASFGTGSPLTTTAATGSEVPASGLEVTAPPVSTTAPAPLNGCSGSAANRAFFAEAASTMTWTVYCAVLGGGWFLDAGTYRLAGGGVLEVSYKGPGDARVGLVEGSLCSQAGSDIDVCAPRDSVIGPAAFGDRTGELGRLSNALVLDVDRGANPSWRATGLGLSEAAFRAICAAMLRVPPG